MMDIRNDDLPVCKPCPFKTACYRRNWVHLTEMSHPHLEKILENQLEGEIRLPKTLEFDCTNRELLMDQLIVLQPILRKRRGETGSLRASSTASSTSTCTSTNEDVKAKIERNRQAAIARKQARLKEAKQQASAVTKDTTSDLQSGPSSSRVDDIEIIEIDAPAKKQTTSSLDSDLEIIYVNPTVEQRAGSPLCCQKRNIPSDITESSSLKKFKSGTASSSSHGRSSQSTSQQSGQHTSIFSKYSTCSNATSREEIRQQAIQKMKETNHKFSIVEPGHFDMKHAKSAPYYIFFARVEDNKQTYNQQNTIVFPEILDRSLGEIVDSLHTTFVLDGGWLCLQYLLAGQNPKMTILCGERADTEQLPTNIKLHQITVPSSFGCHHSKISILRYKDNGIRIIVSTANLYSDDWETRTQGIWISPHLPQLPGIRTGSGESRTGFKKDFINYMKMYKMTNLSEWIKLLESADFSDVNVFFIASVPGTFKSESENTWGHRKLATILAEHATLPSNASDWPIIAQASSIGSLGPDYNSWIGKEIISSMKRESTPGIKPDPPFQFIYPTIQNYANSLDCHYGSCCLPYKEKLHDKQKWIESHLYQWRANGIGRTNAIPHFKSYTRISPDLKSIGWFVLTSANLSKAAWGYRQRANPTILNFEAGVVFVPKFVTGATTFPIQEEDGIPGFRLPYDLPLTKYTRHDKIFTSNI